ncbi:NADH-quinone oxidoreductase subunit NuoN [Timonella senegalensis]|uniref:NADH-quinone oxidoreductase subunit NuoN n=1 Tax=Timonella senegalensis TaxID=1465825 RepID=UPI002FE2E57F
MITQLLTEFQAPTISWTYLLPIIILAGSGILSVLIEALVRDSVRRPIQISLMVGAQVAAFISLIWLGVKSFGPNGSGTVLPVNQALHFDAWTVGIQAVLLICSLLATLVLIDRTSAKQDPFVATAAAVPGSEYEELARQRGLQQTEVFPLVLFAITGMMVFPAAGDLVTMFVALEVLSLPLYVLTAMARRRRLLSQEAAFKYFVLGSFASALFLFGSALLYGYAGTVNLYGIAQVAQAHAQSGQIPQFGLMLILGGFLLLAGILFKIGAAPFQAWTPDVYQGAPTPITGFMAACTKIAAVGVLLRVLNYVVLLAPVDTQRALIGGLWVVAILTMIVGTVAGLTQTDIKRMLAYSSIGHAGFIIVALMGLNASTLSAVVFYLLAYGVATVGAFGIVTLVREVSEGGEVLGEATHIGQWAGLGKRSPFIAGAFSLFLLSFAGLPLTAGFIAKYTAFSSVVATGVSGMGVFNPVPLVIVAIVASAISLFFYIRVIVLMYFVAPAEERALTGELAQAGPNLADPAEDGDEPSSTSPEAVRTSVVLLDSAPHVEVVKSEGPTLAVIVLAAAFVVIAGIYPTPILGVLTSLFGG